MKIIKPGVVPPPKLYYLVCRNCGCEFECRKSEGKYETSYQGEYFSAKCPTCLQTVTADFISITNHAYPYRPPQKHERRVVQHVSGWNEYMNTCVCGRPWPCGDAI